MADEKLASKLKELPKEPGVYFHKDARGHIIYVGKASVLKHRVSQYFQKSRFRNPKTEALVKDIKDIDWMVVDSEIEALFLEAEMIRRYMPKYNILLRDDKSMTYIRIDYDSDYPTVTLTRRPLDDGARYFGPYLSAHGIKQALKLLRKIFPFAVKKMPNQKRVSLYYHIGLDPGLEEGRTSLEDYRANLRRLIAIIEGKKRTIEKDLEKEMKNYAKMSQFEEAAKVRNQLFSLRRLSKQVVFSDKEFLDISKDHALVELVELLNLKGYPKRIEGFDISHQSGTDVVASMVVFTNGVSNKREYRKFKTNTNKNDDFFNMYETLVRRLSERNRKKWGLPDLVLIDGGKGQLDASIRARNESVEGEIPFVGLAKREEQIVIKRNNDKGAPNNKRGSGVNLNKVALQKLGGFVSETKDFLVVNLPQSSNLLKLLQRIRDESHRFAVSYHSTLKTKRQTSSSLDDIPMIGPKTRKKLIRVFGSVRGVEQARAWELKKIIGEKKAKILKQYLHGA